LIVARSLNASFPTEFIYKKIEGNVSCTFVSFDSFIIFIGTNINILYITSIVCFKALIMFLINLDISPVFFLITFVAFDLDFVPLL
jgi:hypothetical protein